MCYNLNKAYYFREINCLLLFPQQSAGNGVVIMDEPTVLRTTKIGGGFVKEDVMTYLDELNSKIVSLEDELKKAQETGPADPQELIKYRNQVDNLQEKLNASNNALRAAKKELEEAQKQHEEDQKLIAQLKSGAPGAAAAANNAQAAAAAQALEAAKKEIDSLKTQLDAAKKAGAQQGGNAQANAQAAAALEAAKKEIESLRAQLKTAEQKAAAAASAAPAAGGGADAAELAKVKAELAKLTADLDAKSKELETRTAELAAKAKESVEKDTKISQLTKDITSATAEKDAEIKKLNDEITELKENAESGGMIPSSFDMGALFTEAQKTANKITIEAQRNADKVTKEANDKADQIVKEANTEAEKTLSNANMTAEACIKEANDQAKTTVDEANLHADKVNEMSATVRKMLLNEIESVNTKFNDITSVLNRLTGQATDRMNEAQLIIGEARKTIDDNAANTTVKKAEAPKAQFEAAKDPAANLNEKSSGSGFQGNFADALADTAAKQMNEINSGSNNNKPAAAPQSAPQQPAAKKSANFNFDMAELLKAAEEEAAKNPEA